MKNVQILGTGCAKCQKLAAAATAAAQELGIEYHIEKITGVREIAQFGVADTPALAIDGIVKVTGRVPAVAEIKKMLA